MFDPFGDYKTEGYLQNHEKQMDIVSVKKLEHDCFEANIEDAINYLLSKKTIKYKDFLMVHKILFSDIYPWAGQDRLQTTPSLAISKGNILFCHPFEIEKYISEGLKLGQNKQIMNKRPGEIMGLFAYGHCFLDGNGRTMLIVHSVLCQRADFSISWNLSNKSDYLNALTHELDRPNHGLLDSYLLQYKSDKLDFNKLHKKITNIKGLDGLDNENKVEGDLNDPEIQKRYQEYEKQRDYKISSYSDQSNDSDLGM